MDGPKQRQVGSLRMLGRSVQAMPLSVRDYRIWYGKAATTLLRKGGAVHLPGTCLILDVGQSRDPADSQEQDEFRIGRSKFGAGDLKPSSIVGLEAMAQLASLVAESIEAP